jgi:hypothetical protein
MVAYRLTKTIFRANIDERLYICFIRDNFFFFF